MVKHVDAAELRVVAATVLAVAADVVLVAQYLLKLDAHLVTALARLHVHNLARRSSLEAGSTQEKKGGEERRNVRNSLWQFGTETGNAGGARACIPNGKAKWFYHSDLSSFGTVQSTLGVGGCGREIFSSATCQLQVGVGRCDADELRQHESSGLFLAFHLLAFHKKLDKDFFCVRQCSF